MKTTIILFVLSISFLPLAISGLPPLIRLPTKADFTVDSAVLDIDGNPVVVGAKYYAVPALRGAEGGISVANLNQGNPSTCPTVVVVNTSIAGYQPPAMGHPITFYPLKLKASGGISTTIVESFPLNVAFHSSDPSDPCAKETVWKLHETENLIVTGGVIGNEDDISNWFRIAKHISGRGYIFTFWSSFSLVSRVGILRVGIVGDGNQLGLMWEYFPYHFNLVKAE